MKTLKFAILALTGLFALVAGPAVAEKTVITDVTGRKVELDLPAKRVLLGEARQVHVIAALKGGKTFETIVGWRDDLVKKDADTYASYRDRFPDIEKLPRFGYVGNGTFDLEAAIALKPDVLTLNLESVKAAEEASLVEKAAAAGIAVVYLDFRVDPEKNTENSIALLGALFGAEEKARILAFAVAGLPMRPPIKSSWPNGTSGARLPDGSTSIRGCSRPTKPLPPFLRPAAANGWAASMLQTMARPSRRLPPLGSPRARACMARPFIRTARHAAWISPTGK